MTAEDWVYNWQANRWLMNATGTVIHDEDMPEELKPAPKHSAQTRPTTPSRRNHDR